MKADLRVFVDSDVVISSLISSSGAAFLLLNQSKKHKLLVSNISVKEMRIVVLRMRLGISKLDELLEERLIIIKLKQKAVEFRKTYGNYVTDVNDAHIVAGAVIAKAKFLITYNVRHYKTEKIRSKLEIVILTPAKYLQYLRSL